MIRQHDVQVLAEGTFRVVLTGKRRVITAIDVPDSALGPLHLVFAVSPEAMTRTAFSTGSIFGDIGHALGHVAHDVGHVAEKAAEGTFNAASKVATTIARPAFDITRDAAAAGANLIAHAPFIPEHERKRLEAASRTVMRAHLGDVNAQQFMHAIGQAAKAGIKEAQHVGDALLSGTRIVARVLDAPMSLMDHIPVVGGMLHSLDPLVKLDHMTGALQRGDFKGLERMIESDAKMAQGVISLIPGIGTGFSVALSAGLAVLDGGGPIDIAIHTAYGAIPIPPIIRNVTDAVVDGVLSLLHRGSITDAALAAARNAIPSGIPRDVFDTLIKLVIKHVPITHVAEELVGTYVKRYAPEIPVPSVVTDAVGHVTDAAASAAKLGGNVPSALDFAAKHLGAIRQGSPVGNVVSLATGAARGQVPTHPLPLLNDVAHAVAPPHAIASLGLPSSVRDAASLGTHAVQSAIPSALNPSFALERVAPNFRLPAGPLALLGKTS